MDITPSGKLENDDLLRKLLGLDLEFYQRMKLRADELKLDVSEFIFKVLAEYFVRLDKDLNSEYNNKVVQFDFNPSDSSQEVQSNQSGVKLDSLNVFDFCGKILDQAEENFANSIGTSDEEQCKEELCRKLREKKRGDYGYEFSCYCFGE